MIEYLGILTPPLSPDRQGLSPRLRGLPARISIRSVQDTPAMFEWSITAYFDDDYKDISHTINSNRLYIGFADCLDEARAFGFERKGNALPPIPIDNEAAS